MSPESQQREKQAKRKLQLASTLRGLSRIYGGQESCLIQLTELFAKYDHPDAMAIHNKIVRELDLLCPDSQKLLKAIAGAIKNVIPETQPT